MERLTERTKDGWVMSSVVPQKLREKLADYEDAEEEGRLFLLPCKPHGFVYIIEDNNITKHEVISYDYSNGNMHVCISMEDNGGSYGAYYPISAVFATEEEAETRLEEMKN